MVALITRRAFMLGTGISIATMAVQSVVARTVLALPALEAVPGPLVKQAFDLLMDRFVTPPSSATVLDGGWDGGVVFVREQAGAEVGDVRPSLSGDRAGDWHAFQSAYPRLVSLAGSTDQVEVDRAIVRGMAASLNSSGTYYVTPSEFQEWRGPQEWAGVGVSLSRELIVTEVFDSSPAQAGGVRRGDRLSAVDAMSVDGKAPRDVSALLRGPAGSTIRLTVQRAGSADLVILPLTRATVPVNWVTGRIVDDQIGYLRFRTFPVSGLDALRRIVEDLDRAGIRALVIDVRGNGGGAVTMIEQVASRFIREGSIYRAADRQGREVVGHASGEYWGRKIPIAVLVDAGTSSGAELLAAALRENGVAGVVGSRTAGTLAGSTYLPLADGSALSVTIQSIRTGKGNEIDGIGVEPDETIETDVDMLLAGLDNQRDATLAYVRSRLGQ